jgi:hypothetical protein
MHRYFILQGPDTNPLNMIRRAIRNEDYSEEGGDELLWLEQNEIDHYYEVRPWSDLARPYGDEGDYWICERVLVHEHDVVAFRLRFGYLPAQSYGVRVG